MRSILKFFRVSGAAVLSVVLVGCASAPRAEIDAAKIRTVHTVTVVYPGKVVYTAARPQFQFVPVVGGAVGAIATATVAGIVDAHHAKQDAPKFDDVVTKKLGDTQLNRRFTDGIEASLRSHGYVVKEVDASAPTLPTFAPDDHAHWHASGPIYRDSDAVLLIRVSPAYSPPGPMSYYSRFITGEIVMFASDTHDAVLRQRIYSVSINDPYSYYSTDLIEADLPHAINGLDESMMAQVGVFDRSLVSIVH
ncbi:hypothetical protein C0Z18_08575 [Trinickia dabaoshanensis]|uniref:Lipoprotein n=1 Tax=Trinickia dabaoshanensis TaxID=564714 RepID=A0A2N7VVP9_9BURK|nr:hypothetical protein [Trinickia dabaoshanensis]PMS21220.1 hypothetical protein C0Z18_08575 [Trinickia dabaoshanensis]